MLKSRQVRLSTHAELTFSDSLMVSGVVCGRCFRVVGGHWLASGPRGRLLCCVDVSTVDTGGRGQRCDGTVGDDVCLALLISQSGETMS